MHRADLRLSASYATAVPQAENEYPGIAEKPRRLLESGLMRFFICGSALRGQPDHGNLGDATFLGEATTAARYRLHSVDDRHPGIYEVSQGGIAIKGELYEFTGEQHTHLLASEPPDLYEGPVLLDDGSSVSAMIYPQALIAERGWRDISRYGGWAAYRADAGVS